MELRQENERIRNSREDLVMPRRIGYEKATPHRIKLDFGRIDFLIGKSQKVVFFAERYNSLSEALTALP